MRNFTEKGIGRYSVKAYLQISKILQEKTCAEVSFLIKSQAIGLQHY